MENTVVVDVQEARLERISFSLFGVVFLVAIHYRGMDYRGFTDINLELWQ